MNIKLNLKFDKSTWLIIIPFLIVTYSLISNIIINETAPVMKFKVTTYDPYDVVMGRYLTINFDDHEIVVPELDGIVNVEGLSDSEEVSLNFAKEYYNLSDDEKNKVDEIFEEMKDEVEKYNTFKSDFEKYYDKLTYINYKLTYNVKFENSYIKDLLAERFFYFARGLNNSNMKFSEYMNRLNIKEITYDDYHETYDRRINFSVYVYYETNKDGYAEIVKISTKKDKAYDNKKCRIFDDTRYYNLALFNTYQFNDDINKYYMDERIVEDADRLMRNAISDGKEVACECKIFSNRMQIKNVLVDGIKIEEYVDLYKDELYEYDSPF